MKDSHVIPTVFAYDKKEFLDRFKKLTPISHKLQIDFMDGKLVESKSFSLKDVPDLTKIDNEIEAHLMVKNPQEWIPKCKEKGFKRVIFHIEAMDNTQDAENTIKIAKDNKLEVYIAINPETPLERIYPFVEKLEVNGILLMGVHPGKEGQSLAGNTAERIRKLKNLNFKMLVQIDGGINDKTIEDIAHAGADIVNSGGFVGKAKDPAKALALLEKLFSKSA